MNKYLTVVNNWYYENKLHLNTKKTMYIAFGNRSDTLPSYLNIHLDNKPLTRVQHTSYMGVIFDQNLKFKEHVYSIFKRTRYLIYIFAKLRNILSNNNLISIYYALFHSIATYGIIAWGSAYENSLNLLLKLQKKIFYLITNNNCNNNSSKILNIHQTYIYKSIINEYQTLKDIYLFANTCKVVVKPDINTLNCHSVD